MESGWKPKVDQISPNCPRCGSCNTKFCYYNNYSLTQPRYFCKGCRRYWTKGGSLRNVPVGGGCRKNRRGKSLRLSSTDGVQSGSLSNGNLPNGPLMGNSLLVESTSSSLMNDGSHIDLALVYAKFLNQKPDSKTGFELPEFPSDFDSRLESLSISNTNMSSGTQLVEENGFFECQLTLSHELSVESFPSANGQIYFCGSASSTQKHDQADRTEQSMKYDTSNYGLPPLPGEDIIASNQEVVWSSSQMMLNHNFQAVQLPGQLGPEAQDPNPMISNWMISPFDLSSSDQATFSRI
ncbi:hypothetical protein I3843_10G018200 [Carya illinoinensis]|nr:hypothetical protein I3760_10G017900 [Carya illinoinensis]KAG7958377.1 hypothetical protein I3843_10G018200 [Carya illinoinensis]